MKDYYYILGLKELATSDDIKKAYRKLSLKFHPDTNDGDEFFTEHFKEIQEAYEILMDKSKRASYDILKNNVQMNANPEIEYFKSNKVMFEYDEEVTFSWKTDHANKVILNPFGLVDRVGQKTYKIKDFKNKELNFVLIAENSNTNKQIKSSLILINKTYKELFNHFKDKKAEEQNERPPLKTETSSITADDSDKAWTGMIIGFNVLIVIGVIIYFLTK